jgi:hypothetical protein
VLHYPSMNRSRLLLGLLLAFVCLIPLGVWGATSQSPDTRAQALVQTTIHLQVGIPGFNSTQPVDENLFGNYLRAFYQFFVGAVSVLATVMIVYGGLRWVTAAGNSAKIGVAKETIQAAIIGLVLALTSFVLLRTINPKLVQLTIPTITPIERVGQDDASSSVFCDPTNARITLTNTQCGDTVTYQTASGISRNCISNVCDPFVGGNGTGRDGNGLLCTFRANATTVGYTCLPAKTVCADADPSRCFEIDRAMSLASPPFIDSDGRRLSCKKADLALERDKCELTPLLTCPVGATQLRCDAAGARNSPCWDNGQPRQQKLTTRIPGESGTVSYFSTCSNADEKPGEFTGSICCATSEKNFIACSPQPPTSNQAEDYLEVSCADYDGGAITYLDGTGGFTSLTTCPAPNHCYEYMFLFPVQQR